MFIYPLVLYYSTVSARSGSRVFLKSKEHMYRRICHYDPLCSAYRGAINQSICVPHATTTNDFAFRIIIGPPKQFLHLVWSVFGISTASFESSPRGPKPGTYHFHCLLHNRQFYIHHPHRKHHQDHYLGAMTKA